MTKQPEHRAMPNRGTGGGRIACSCGQWRSEYGDALSNERAAHRAHCAEMAAAVKPTVLERLAEPVPLHLSRGLWYLIAAGLALSAFNTVCGWVL
ncbi:hypothetical protein [Streptodolium elevatio]|uniref:Uncharacterized protein n=1 Tax=Streptodolium elevatio TaxID=3157996 RepID=A0ABV3DJZ8_9ACTN